MALLFVWGHSWELFDWDSAANTWTTKNDKWTDFESFLSAVGGHNDIWYATVLQVADYLNAARDAELSLSDDSVHNVSSISLWYETGSDIAEIPPGETWKPD